MKRCPECRKDYLDESLLYCLDDGSPLLQGTVGDDPPTAILSGGSGEGITRALKPEGTGRVTIDLPAFFARPALPWILASVLGLLLVAGWAYYRSPRGDHGTLTTLRFNIAPPKDAVFGESIAISPDGRRIAFAAQNSGGESALFVRALDEIEPVKLSGTEGARFPFWSPDSRSIAFFASAKLKRVDAAGGPPQIIADVGIEPRGGSWGRDGTILFSPQTNTPLLKVSAAGGPVTEGTRFDTERGDVSHRWPSFLPDGRHFLYFERCSKQENQGVAIASLDGKENKLLFNSRVMALYAPPSGSSGNGHLLYARDGVLMAHEFDPAKLELVGEPVPIAPTVQSYPTEAGPTALGVTSVSDNGTLVFRSGSTAITQLRWADRTGKLGDALTAPGIYHEPVLSRDGKSVVVSVEDPGKGQDVWILDATRKVLTRATFDPGLDGSGLLSPDGSTLFFASNRKGQFAIYKKPSTGVGNDVFVYGVDGDDIFPDSVSPDGRWLLVDHGGRLSGGRPSVEGVDLTGAEKPFRLSDSTGAVQHAQFSPDGKWVSYSSDESGRPEVYVQPFPATGGKWQVSTAGGDQSLWNMNGKEIFYLALDRRMMSVPVTAGTSLRVAQATPLFVTTIPVTGLVDERANYAVSPDGQHILINGLVEAVNEVPITVFLNWETSLRK